jgi:hypothetical protein
MRGSIWYLKTTKYFQMKQFFKFRQSTYLLLFLMVFLSVYSCTKEHHPDYSDKVLNVSIDEIKGFYHGKDIQLDNDKSFQQINISGVVLTDFASGNTPAKKGFIMQEDNTGIMIMLQDGDPGDLAMGDSVVVNIDAGTVTSVNGNIAVTGIGMSDVSKLNEKGTVTAKPVAVSELITNFPKYEGSLVKVIGAEVSPHADEEKYAGDKELDDGTGGVIQLHTESSASFANDLIPQYGTFTGIAFYGQSGEDSLAEQLWMRNGSDMEEFIPSPYPIGFPENFNTQLVKDQYAADNLNLNSGNWTFDGVTLVTITGSRPINPDGTKGVQFNQKNTAPEYLQMNFDVYKGASKVTILYGSYGSDPGCTWCLQYSTDGGASWTQIGDNVEADNKTAQTATFSMNLKGTVRFRVCKLGLGAANNGRLNMDDFTIYNNS